MTSFFGMPGKIEQAPTQSSQQQQLFAQLLQGLGGAQGGGLDWLSALLSGDEDAFAQFEAPIKRQYQQEIMPGIAERFAGMGSHGSLGSSGLNRSLAQSGKELSESLGSLRGGLQQNALGQLQGLMSQAYQPTFENLYRQPTQGILGGLLQGLGSGAGQYAGLKLGGGV